MNPLELINFVKTNVPERDQIRALAALADAPPDDYKAKVRLPVQNKLPAFKIGNEGLGSLLAGQNYGVPAPVPGEKATTTPSIGELIVGESNARS